MYADTPPTLVAVHPELLRTPADVQAVAWRVSDQLRSRPIWVAVPPSPVKDGSDTLGSLLLDDPSWHILATPGTILAEAIRRAGAELPVEQLAAAERVPRRSSVVDFAWDGIAPEPLGEMATALGTREILVLAPRGLWMAGRIAGFREDVVDPRAAPLRPSF